MKTSPQAIMTKLQKCEDIMRHNDNSCSRYFCGSIFHHTSVLQLSQQENLSIIPIYDSWIITVFGFILTLALCYSLYTWYKQYRLRYLLRICFLGLFTLLGINVSCFIESCILDNFDIVCKLQRHTGNVPSIISAVATAVMCCIRFYWSLPLNIRRALNSESSSNPRITFKNVHKTAKQLTEDKLQSGILKELPPVYPNGWIPVLESTELLPKSTKTVTAIGRKFCVFRGSDEKAYILDAYCPHLGAELAAGGKVLNNCIECPFHGWQFDGQNGQCSAIPYADKIPEVAKIKSWKSCEKNGFIFVWYHADNEEPTWEMPSVSNVESGLWPYRGRTEHVVHCHIQEIPENGADIAHLHMIHSKSVFSGLQTSFIDTLLDHLKHNWEPRGWEPDEERPHVAKVKLIQRASMFGVNLTPFKLTINIEQIGPATVHLHLESRYGCGILLQCIMTESPLSHRIIHLLYTESSFGQFPADMVILSEARMLDRDIAVWNNKRFLRRPVLVREDKLITRFRRWYSQFYSEHSPTLKEIRENTLEW